MKRNVGIVEYAGWNALSGPLILLIRFHSGRMLGRLKTTGFKI
jgi:hypothetical protein